MDASVARVRHIGLLLCFLLCSSKVGLAAPTDCQRVDLASEPANLAEILQNHRKWLDTRDTRRPKGTQANLSHVNLTGVRLSGDLREVILTGSNLQGAIFNDAQLDWAELSCVQAE